MSNTNAVHRWSDSQLQEHLDQCKDDQCAICEVAESEIDSRADAHEQYPHDEHTGLNPPWFDQR